MSLSMYCTFVGIETVLCLAPGPAVMLIISQGLFASARASLYGTAGILAANALYFGLSAAGIGAVLTAWPAFFEVIKWSGAAYLVYLGLSMLLAKAIEDGGPSPRPGHDYFLQGLFLQIANPKAIVFFVALLPQFITTGASVASQCFILGATSIAIESVVLAAYGAAAASARRFVPSSAIATFGTRICGACLIAVAIGLALADVPWN